MPSPKLHELGAAQAAALLQRRELKAEDLVRACLERVAARDDDIHAFTHVDAVSPWPRPARSTPVPCVGRCTACRWV